MAADTASIAFEVTGLEPVYRGSLVALAVVELDLDGVPLTLQGVQVRRSLAGLEVCAPMCRAPDGTWAPAVVLPPELAAAIAETVTGLCA